MKLQPASKREIRRIAIGTAACDGILIAGLFLLSQFDIGSFDPEFHHHVPDRAERGEL